MLNLHAQTDDTATLPNPTDIFASPERFETVVASDDKVAGQSDSVRGMKSVVKAPGGKDAARQKDGG